MQPIVGDKVRSDEESRATVAASGMSRGGLSHRIALGSACCRRSRYRSKSRTLAQTTRASRAHFSEAGRHDQTRTVLSPNNSSIDQGKLNLYPGRRLLWGDEDTRLRIDRKKTVLRCRKVKRSRIRIELGRLHRKRDTRLEAVRERLQAMQA